MTMLDSHMLSHSDTRKLRLSDTLASVLAPLTVSLASCNAALQGASDTLQTASNAMLLSSSV